MGGTGLGLRRMKAVAVIPARYASTRLPGKPLLRETGKYLIQHVCEQAAKSSLLSGVIVATDDRRVFDAVRSCGFEARMTRADHPSGTDRVAEVASDLDADIIVNVQGDEPEMEPGAIDTLVAQIGGRRDVGIATLACPFPEGADPSAPSAVKVVVDLRGRAMYFSRALVPFPRDGGGRSDEPSRWLLHLGMYAYRRATLLEIAKLRPTPMETAEKLEQLRFLENGYEIMVGIVDRAAVGVDTPEDYAAFVRRYRDAASRSTA